ncbi:G4 quadruplex nucleic acid binding protein [Naganishia albida]|nr:G4 quadruplex nucleic acid binding protein [Naganishia albida]
MSSSSTFVEKVQALQPELVGTTDEEKSKIQSLVNEVPALAKDLQALNTKLTPLVYLNSNKPSIADVSLYCELHPEVSKLEPSGYYAVPSVTRYFDHIQHLKAVNEARTILPNEPYWLVNFDLDNMPPLERKVEVKEKKPKKDGAAADASAGKKDKKEKKPAEQTPAETKPVEEAKPAAEGEKPQGQKKEKKPKEKKPEGDKKAAKPAPPPPTGPLPSMIDLRVGKVLEVSRHPDADSLYVEKIDVGEEEPRIVCSGLVAYMKPEEIQDQTIVVVCNLKPVTMRGVKSFAMLLCATAAEGKEGGIEFVRPPAGSKPGERIYFEGEKYENAQPEPLLNPKKKVFETVQPGFITLDTLEAAWVDPETKSVHKIRTKDGVCAVQKFKGASLS